MSKSNNEILFPIFLHCVEYSLDKFWGKIFEDLSYGKTPYGVYFNRDCLCCGKGKTGESTHILDTKDPEQLHDNVYRLLNGTMGIMSPDERLKKQQDFIDIEEANKSNLNKWSDIKKKTTKDLLIELFAVEMKRTHNLNIKQTRYLISFICMAILFKSITPYHIEMDNGRIVNIIGIDFTDSHMDFDLELYSAELDESTTGVSGDLRVKMIENWEKYIFGLKKKNDFL
jgi:hypothetical protein